MQIIRLKYKTLTNQFGKITEEVLELSRELQKKEPNKEKILAEAWDVIQATLGIIFMVGRESLKSSYKKHLLKLQGRKERKVIEVDEYLEL